MKPVVASNAEGQAKNARNDSARLAPSGLPPARRASSRASGRIRKRYETPRMSPAAPKATKTRRQVPTTSSTRSASTPLSMRPR